MLTLNFVYLECIKINLYFSLEGFLKYTLILFFSVSSLPNFSNPHSQIFIILYLSEVFIFGFSLYNLTYVTKALLSLTTVTPSAVQQSSVQLFYLQQVCVFSLFP
jgi:hypothetical protein